jgi:serine/threonine protein kinase
MSYCLNPQCQNPQNADFVERCQSCGTALHLQNQYQAVRQIGRGGFGRTFLAVNLLSTSKPRCVIKQFYPQQQGTDNLAKASDLFRQESQRLAELGNHPQIPTLLDYLEQDGYQYLIQEFIDGNTLEQALAQGEQFNELDIRQLLRDLLPVIQFIHTHQVIHRDIKPANIIRRRADRRLTLVDLGAAKQATGTALAKTGTVIGSAEYTAPEQARGKAVFASDLYSLGVTCVHLLTEMSPFDLFDGGNGCWVWQDYLRQPVSAQLRAVLDRMLHQATNQRYQASAEILEDLYQPEGTVPIAPFPQKTAQDLPLYLDRALQQERDRAKQSLNVSYEQGGEIAPASVNAEKSLVQANEQREQPHQWLSFSIGLLGFLVMHGLVAIGFWQNRSNPPIQSSPAIVQPQPELLDFLQAVQEPEPKFSHSVKPTRTLASQGFATSLAVSADGKTLVVGNDDSRPATDWRTDRLTQPTHTSNAQIWNLSTGKLVSTLSTQYPVWDVAIGADGKTIATQSASMAINTNQSLRNPLQSETRLWNPSNGELLHTLPTSGPAISVALSPDGKFVATLGRGVELWEVSTGKQVQTLSAGSRAIVFSPDNQTLAASGDLSQATLYVWNWRDGKLVATLNDTVMAQDSVGGWYRSIAFSSDGKMLVAGFNGSSNIQGVTNSFVQVWDALTYQPTQRFAQSGKVLSVAISPNKTLIASAGAMNGPIDSPALGKVNLWDVRTGQLVRSLTLPDVVLSVRFSPDGKQLFCGGQDKQITIWQVSQLIVGS